MLLNNTTYTRRMQMLLLLFFISSLTLILHALGMQAYLYWALWWFDVLMHALGGFALGLLISFFLPHRDMRIFFVLLFAVIIGWEAFEIVALKVHIGATQYVTDTIVDICIGLISGYAAMALYFRK